MAQNNIKSEDISVVVQGPIHKKRTKKTLLSIRKNLPNAQIILSTWENSDVDGLEYDILILNKDPGAVLQKKIKRKALYNNLNRMILSTNSGVNKATRKYILKLRTDAYINNLGFLEMFNSFSKRCEEYKLFKKRIIASTLFSKIALNKRGQVIELPFHVSDWWFFGLSEDIKEFLLCCELQQEPYFSNYFEHPDNKNKISVYNEFDWKLAPEQYIGYCCFSKYYDDIKLEDCSNVCGAINKKSQICLANNFIFLEYKQSGISNLKYPYSKNELLVGNQYLYLYSFYKFEEEYKKYCDSNYIPTEKTLIFSDEKTANKILRLYKHVFKLLDEESSSLARVEQLFFGIPISIIGLFPVLFKILKNKFKALL